MSHPEESFLFRHIGLREDDIKTILSELGFKTSDDFLSQVVPPAIRLKNNLKLPEALSEKDALKEVRALAKTNIPHRAWIGMGYYGTFTPPVIQRNILENPGWYTQYTPYQAEISQGRLEALLNFQTLITDLTGFPLANSSLLDEATAAAEAMHLCKMVHEKEDANSFLVDENTHPQTIEVMKSRAQALGWNVVIGEPEKFSFGPETFGCLLSYPGSDGKLKDPTLLISKAKSAKVQVVMATDLLSLLLLKSPGELGADVAIGSSQRFGVPMGYGGPHAAFFATKDEFKRLIPGRIVGVSKDVSGKTGLRLALQTREQHIRREKATSNICTAQVLLAVMASFYAVYHGPKNLKRIAERTHRWKCLLSKRLKTLGFQVSEEGSFDTFQVQFKGEKEKEIFYQAAKRGGFLLGRVSDTSLGISLDELTDAAEISSFLSAVTSEKVTKETLSKEWENTKSEIPAALIRKSTPLLHPVFNSYHSETELLRYIKKLESRDLSLTRSMIPLGSCTMKLNATSEMFPVTDPGFSDFHPFCPKEMVEGYQRIFSDLEAWLSEITGMKAVSLEPNAGSQGEFAGLLVIKKYLETQGQTKRKVCLIPKSAHGTNPASAVLAGMQVVVVECDSNGNVDLEDLEKKAEENKEVLAALMVTYPSTHGVFEESIQEICSIVHRHGGQVYMDGANMNAQVSFCRPGDFGADVCHLNLHKTFCIPHGGGGPGMGPIAVKEHLAPHLPGRGTGKGKDAIGAISAAPYGSPGILPIPWMYIRMMGPDGLKRATEAAILNANYLAKKLGDTFPVLYQGKNGLVAHECILDLRPFKSTSGVEVEDVAKRLMDYGFHAPTISFPVPGTLMVEPTESESIAELDRFIDAMLSIREEIREIESGKMDQKSNPLKNAPHTAEMVTRDAWDFPYSREKAAFPRPWVRENKFWTSVARIDNVYGDRNLFCTCPADFV